MRIVNFYAVLVLSACSVGTEVDDKHEWSVLEAASWNLKDRPNIGGPIVVQDAKWGDRVLAVPQYGKELGFSVVLISRKDKSVIKAMPKGQFQVAKSDTTAAKRLVQNDRELVNFINTSSR